MSTKIYNGYLFPILEDTILLERLWESQKLLAKKRNELIRNQTNCLTYLQARWDIQTELSDNSKKGYRFPLWDFSFEVTYFPVVIEDKRLNLGLMYCEHQEMKDVLAEHLEATYYGYWNNTDRPDELTEEEWKLREKHWDYVLPYSCPVSAERGLSMTLVPTFLPNVEEVFGKEEADKAKKIHWEMKEE